MIPYRDANPSERTPYVTVSLILLNVLVFFYELSQGPQLERFLFDFGVVPRKWFYLGHEGITLGSVLFPYLTSIFLHGGFVHLAGNMWYLWIFGDNVEDRLGHGRFLIFYLLAGLGAGMVHTFFNLQAALPAVGASGSIAGVLGAYLLLFPHARVSTLLPLGFHYEVVELPAMLVLGFWFVMQLFSGAMAIGMTAQTGGVAWWAHIGGFLLGMFLLQVFLPRKSRV